MSRHETCIQYAKIVLLGAILALAVWSFGNRPPVEAQLAASSGFNFTQITGAANNQIKTSNGTLHNIMINGGTLTGVITVVDTGAANCTGGTQIALIAQPQVAGQNYTYNLQFTNGLCITSAAAVNATVDWR